MSKTEIKILFSKEHKQTLTASFVATMKAHGIDADKEFLVLNLQALNYENEINIEKPDKPHIIFQIILGFISSLATQDPTKAHFDIVRAIIKKINTRLLKDNAIIDIMARNLAEQCKILKLKLIEYEPIQPLINNIISGKKKYKFDKPSTFRPLLISIIELNLSPESESKFECDNMFLWDKFFLDLLMSLGDTGREASEKFKNPCHERLDTFKKNEKNPLVFWFNCDSTFTEEQFTKEPFYVSPALQILAGCIYEDIATKSINYHTIRISGHMADQEFASKFQTTPLPEIRKNIIPLTQWEQVHEGLTELSVLDHKVISAFRILLHQKSQTINPKSSDFYAGNEAPQIIKNGNIELLSPVIRITKHEYYKAFAGKDDYSGKDQKTADKALASLANRKFLTIWTRKKMVQKNNNLPEELYDRIEICEPLFQTITVFKDLTNKQNELVCKGDATIRQKKGEVVIALNPIFRDQIDTKYLQYPTDLTKRIRSAAYEIGCKEASSTYCLITYLTREHSNKRYTSEISEQAIKKYMGLGKLENEGRQKRIQERIENDIKMATKIGLIKKHEKVTRKNPIEGKKYIFYLNSNWPKAD